MRDRTGLAVIGLALVGCGPSLGDIGYSPLPGPAPDSEVVAVSSAIASVDHPVFYYRDPDNPHRLIAYDWDGMRRGAIDVTASEPYGVYPTADGRMLLLMHAHLVSGGQPVGQVANGTWAGDNRHLCVFLNQLGGPGMPRTRQIGPNSYQGINTPGTLFYQTVGGPSRRVVDYGAFGPHGGPAILACSARTDRAVIVQTFVASQSDLEVIRLSDGQLISQGIARSASQPDGLVASADGTLLGEGSTASGWNPGGENSFVVRRLPDGQVLAHITGGGIEAFSADDSKVLVVQYQNGGSQSGRYQTIDLATLRSTWSAVLTPGTVRTRPGTGDFLVASRSWELSKTRANGNDPFEDVWLVPANGPARLLLQHVPPLE
jgi:hypothetical protein